MIERCLYIVCFTENQSVMDESSDSSFELQSAINSSSESDLYSPDEEESENLSDSDSDDHHIVAKAQKAVEFPVRLMETQIGRLKVGLETKVESMRQVKIEVKEELNEVRDENAELQRQVGVNEGKAEFLARENEVFTCSVLQKNLI